MTTTNIAASAATVRSLLDSASYDKVRPEVRRYLRDDVFVGDVAEFSKPIAKLYAATMDLVENNPRPPKSGVEKLLAEFDAYAEKLLAESKIEAAPSVTKKRSKKSTVKLSGKVASSDVLAEVTKAAAKPRLFTEKISANAKRLFALYAADAANWGGTPLFNGNVSLLGEKEDRGLLTVLKKAKLVTSHSESAKDAGTSQDCTWIEFTEKGREYAAEIGVSIEGGTIDDDKALQDALVALSFAADETASKAAQKERKTKKAEEKAEKAPKAPKAPSSLDEDPRYFETMGVETVLKLMAETLAVAGEPMRHTPLAVAMFGNSSRYARHAVWAGAGLLQSLGVGRRYSVKTESGASVRLFDLVDGVSFEEAIEKIASTPVGLSESGRVSCMTARLPRKRKAQPEAQIKAGSQRCEYLGLNLGAGPDVECNRRVRNGETLCAFHRSQFATPSKARS